MPKRKRLCPQQLRAAHRELPIKHINPDRAPAPLVQAFNRSLRETVIYGMTSKARRQFSNLSDEIARTPRSERRTQKDGYAALWIALLGEIWDGIPENIRDSYCPQTMPWMQPSMYRGSATLTWLNWGSIKTSGGAFWYGKSSTLVDGLVPAFSRHAIDRLRDRALDGKDNEYIALFDFHSRISQCLDGKILPWYVDDELHGFSTWERYRYSVVPDVLGDDARGVLGDEVDDDDDCYIVTAYHPCKFNGRYALGLTSLLPGMRGTPQYVRGVDVPGTFDEFSDLPGFKHMLELHRSQQPVVSLID
jgi:hypothetical protein